MTINGYNLPQGVGNSAAFYRGCPNGLLSGKAGATLWRVLESAQIILTCRTLRVSVAVANRHTLFERVSRCIPTTLVCAGHCLSGSAGLLAP